MSKMKILFLLDNPFVIDKRVYREAKTLIGCGYELVLIARKGNNLKEEELVDGIKVIRLFNDDIFDPKQPNSFYYYAHLIIQKIEFDIVHAHDQTMLHLGAIIKQKTSNVKLVYDSHELFHAWPLNQIKGANLITKIKSAIVRKLAVKREFKNRKAIDYLITVNDSLAEDLKNYFRFTKPICVLRNAPEKFIVSKKSNVLRSKFNIPDQKKIVVFIGANIYAKTLNLEQVINEIANKEDLVLIFICALNANSKPIKEYVESRKVENVYFHDILPPQDVQTYLSSADVGLVPTWNKKDLSYWYALDNKLFEYIQSKIPVLATQQPEYVKIIDAYKCGICVNPDKPGAYLTGLKSIIKNYDNYALATEVAAADLCWENEEKKLVDLYKIISHE